MLTKGFYYFLVIGEAAILGLLIAGIYAKVKSIMSMSGVRRDDQISERHVSQFNHGAGVGAEVLAEARVTLPGRRRP